MSIDISSKLMVGLPYSHIEKYIERAYFGNNHNDSLDEMLEYFELDWAIPFLNAYPENWFVGIEISTTKLEKTNWETFNQSVQIAYDRFRLLTRYEIIPELSSVVHVT